MMLPKYKQKPTLQNQVTDFLVMNLGLFIVASSSVLFKKPHHFASGGINGFSIVLQHYFPGLALGVIMMVTNALLLVVGYLLVDKKFIIKSIYGALALSGFTWLLEVALPFELPFTDQKLLELIFAVGLAGIGSTLAFYKGASTGGTDILAMVFRRFFNLKISNSLLVVDFAIALTSGLAYGAETMLFSVLGVIIKIFVMDIILENIQASRIFTIVADPEKSKIIQSFIVDKLGRSATATRGEGAFTATEKIITTVILEKNQALYLQNFICENDPAAFVSITTSNLIIGRGFGRGL